MSWQVSVTQIKREDAEEKLEEAGKAYWHTVNPNALEEAQEQFEAAVTAALSLLDVVQTGDADRAVNITLSGHANVEHGEQEGYANETVTVTVAAAV